MNRIIIPLLLLAITVASACNRRAGTGEQALTLPKIVNDPNYPNKIYLRIAEITEADTAYLYSVRGLFDNDTLGFIVSLDREIAPGINEDGTVRDEGFRAGSVKFLRSGEESDQFIAALAQLWGLDELMDKGFSTEPVVPLAFSSNKGAVDQTKPTTNSFKLFFDPDAEEPGEIFFTVDLYRRGVELHEKDAEYREAIVRTLSDDRD